MMSSRSVVKSPTLCEVVPTFVLEPAVLARTCIRSGYGLGCATVRVQKRMIWPLNIGTTGVSNQLLIVPVPEVLLKLAPM